MNSGKLSNLQKQILVLALQNHIEEGHKVESTGCLDLYNSQLLAEVYRFPARSQRRWKHYLGVTRHRRDRLDFDVDEIGHARYNAAMEAVSRAMARLEEGGLALRFERGCSLTPSGVEAAQAVNIYA